MRSIAAHIDPATIVAQIRMERQTHKGSFLLVEGSTDAKRMDKFVDQAACSLVNCYGKQNVIGAIELMQDVGLEDCLGMVDADFDRVRNHPVNNESIVYSKFHDFDLDNALTGVIDRYLIEVADEAKLADVGGARACVDMILKAIKPLSILRYANEIRRLRYDLTRLKMDVFFDGHSVNIDKMIDEVSFREFEDKVYKDALRLRISEIVDLDFDLLQLTNGHDFIAALGLALRDRVGNRRPPQTWGSEVEMHLRFGLLTEEFASTLAHQAISNWENSSNGFKVLRQ